MYYQIINKWNAYRKNEREVLNEVLMMHLRIVSPMELGVKIAVFVHIGPVFNQL